MSNIDCPLDSHYAPDCWGGSIGRDDDLSKLVTFMRHLQNVGRAMALAPLLTACVTLAGGNPDDLTAPPTTAPEAASEPTQPAAEPQPSTQPSETQTDSFQQARPPVDDSDQTDAAAGAGQTGSQGTGPLEDVPLVIDLSDLRDADGLGSLSIQWQQYDSERGSWTKIDGATSQGFTPRQAHVGNQLRVSIEYLDGRGNLESILTQPTPPVRNVNDPPTGELRLVGSQLQYETLKADISVIRDEEGIGPITYAWEISSDGATWQRYRGDDWIGDTVVLSQQEVGRYLRAVIRYTDGFGKIERVVSAATDPIRNVNDPVQGELVLRGNTKTGETLRVETSSISDRDGIANTTLIWEASEDGQTWRRAAESSQAQLTLGNDLVDRQIRVRGVVVDRFGNEGTLISNNLGPVQGVNSAPTGTIRILSVD